MKKKTKPKVTFTTELLDAVFNASAEIVKRLADELNNTRTETQGFLNHIDERLSKLEAAQPAPEPPKRTMAEEHGEHGISRWPWQRKNYLDVPCWVVAHGDEVRRSMLRVFNDGSMMVSALKGSIGESPWHPANSDGTITHKYSWLTKWRLGNNKPTLAQFNP